MAAAGNPMIELLAQLATLAASNATLQGQVASMQPGAQATQPTTYTRTPDFRGQTDLLNFGKKADLSVYVEGKSPVLEGDERFVVKTETLRQFQKKLCKKVTDQGWNDANNTQQIALFNITHNRVSVQINITKAYGCIEVTEL